MNRETLALQEFALGFAIECQEARDPDDREIQRRNLLTSLVLLEEQQRTTHEEVLVALRGLYHDPRWRDRRRLVFAGIEPTGRTPLPASGIELLESLRASDGRYVHNLNVPVP